MGAPSSKPQKHQNKDILSLAQATVTAALRGEIQAPEQANKMMKELAYRAKIENPDLAIRIDAAKARLDSALTDLRGSNLTEKKAIRQKALLDISRILKPENFSSRKVDIQSSERALKSRFNILQQHFSALLYYQNTVENSDPFALRQKN